MQDRLQIQTLDTEVSKVTEISLISVDPSSNRYLLYLFVCSNFSLIVFREVVSSNARSDRSASDSVLVHRKQVHRKQAEALTPSQAPHPSVGRSVGRRVRASSRASTSQAPLARSLPHPLAHSLSRSLARSQSRYRASHAPCGSSEARATTALRLTAPLLRLRNGAAPPAPLPPSRRPWTRR